MARLPRRWKRYGIENLFAAAEHQSIVFANENWSAIKLNDLWISSSILFAVLFNGHAGRLTGLKSKLGENERRFVPARSLLWCVTIYAWRRHIQTMRVHHKLLFHLAIPLWSPVNLISHENLHLAIRMPIFGYDFVIIIVAIWQHIILKWIIMHSSPLWCRWQRESNRQLIFFFFFE